MNSGTISALVVGVVMGVLSSLPVVNLGLCVWIWLGGIAAVVLARLLGGQPLTRAEGTLLGLLTGTVAAVVTIGFTLGGVGTFSEVVGLFQSAPAQERNAVQALDAASMMPTLTGCLSLGLHMGGGALGGAIGAALTRR